MARKYLWIAGELHSIGQEVAQLEAENDKMRSIILACPECKQTVKDSRITMTHSTGVMDESPRR